MSNKVVVDTDVASYLFKNSPLAKPFRPLLRGKRPALAFVSVAELFRWSLRKKWGPKNVEELERALTRYILVPYERDLAWTWARVVTTCQNAGRTIAPHDAWVAACALRHDAELTTNNVKDFEPIRDLLGLTLLLP